MRIRKHCNEQKIIPKEICKSIIGLRRSRMMILAPEYSLRYSVRGCDSSKIPLSTNLYDDDIIEDEFIRKQNTEELKDRTLIYLIGTSVNNAKCPVIIFQEIITLNSTKINQ